MKKLLILVPLITLVGCASSQPTQTKVEIPTIPDFDVRMMTRSEVVTAVNECETNDMKPFVEYISQKTTYGRVMVPVNVHCNPLKK